MSRFGPTLLLGAAFFGFVVAIVNYVSPDNGISGTPGALLVVASTAALALAGFALSRRVARGVPGGVLWHGIAVVLLAGTAFAAWLLEAPTLVALMTLAAIGWLCTMGLSATHR